MLGTSRALPGLLLLLLLLGACGQRPIETPATKQAAAEAQADAVRASAARWLWARQARDGGWHGETDDVLRSGQSLTALILDALLQVPTALVPRDENLVRRALAFLVSHVDEAGAIGLSEPGIVDYPNYATALTLPLVRRNIGPSALAERLRDRLLGQQFKRATGWPEKHPAYGAWGMGAGDVQPSQPGHLDLSTTRYVLEALAAERGKAPDAARTRALIFLARCASPGGGYFSSTVQPERNKAGPDGQGSWRGYGTCTADAILALRAAGVGAEDPRLQAAQEWLLGHHRLDRVPGLPESEDNGWALSLRYYYRAAAARALALMNATEAPAGSDWRLDMIAAFAKEQRPDGSFVNRGSQMKEDDPYVATALVLHALADLRY
jgi:squalene-hopene/tetraprenyl-beta-curcumene cyclase